MAEEQSLGPLPHLGTHTQSHTHTSSQYVSGGKMLAPVEAVLPWAWDGDPRAPVAFGRCLCRAEGTQPWLGDFPSSLTARGPREARREVVLRTVAGGPHGREQLLVTSHRQAAQGSPGPLMLAIWGGGTAAEGASASKGIL